MSSSGLSQFKLTFELSPILLTGGIAQNAPGGVMPIITLTGDDATEDPSDFFANFVPVPGGTLIDQDVGRYPFANQAVAANAVIANPLAISMRMITPVKSPYPYPARLSIITGLQAALAKHNASGGTYIVATPCFYYVNCLMLKMSDVGPIGDSAVQQTQWQFDFYKPLLTLQDAQQAQNNLMSKLSSGTQVNGDPAWSGLSSTVGNPNSLAGPNVIQGAQDVGGAGIAPPGS